MFSSFPPPTKYWIIGQGGVITCIVAHNCFTVCFFILASFELHLVFLTGRGENKNTIFTFAFFSMVVLFANTNDSVH